MASPSASPLHLVPRQLTSLPGKALPPSIPLIISSQDNWNSNSCQLETQRQDLNNRSLKLVEDALELLRSIDKPLAVLSICGPYRSGKSYFISRLLGSPGAFKLGHSMQACTRGVWMATTVLECEEYTTILLDTEGIDAVGASETFAMSLLTLTTLLSSFLIYNSKKVPQKVDLSKMKCFSQLSTSLLAQIGDSVTPEVAKMVFPHFLWLLRDVCLKMTDKEGKVIGPTEFLHTRILKAESGELTEVGKSVTSLFPSLECATLPIPSIKRDVIRNIFEQQEKLKPAFNTAVDNLVQKILHDVTPKRANDGTTLVDGCTFATLACGYVAAINKPGAIPDLDQGWQAVVRLELKEISDRLVKEYRKEMEECLKGNLPMEDRNLMRLHQQTLKQKKSTLQDESQRVNPLHSSDEEVLPLLRELERDIVQWNDEGRTNVVGGALFQFSTENYSKSKQQCENVFSGLMKESNIEAMVAAAIVDSEVLDISEEIVALLEKYNSMAVGPAATEVMERGLEEVSRLRNTLKMIQSKPVNIVEVGRDTDRIKLSWEPPKCNPEAVEFYIISRRGGGGEWEEVKQTEKTKALITGLKSNTEYEFEIKAMNSLIMSIENEQKLRTRRTTISLACKIVEVSANLPMLMQLMYPLRFSVPKGKKGKMKCIATLPASILLSPITIPVGSIYITKLLDKRRYRDKGDLTEE